MPHYGFEVNGKRVTIELGVRKCQKCGAPWIYTAGLDWRGDVRIDCTCKDQPWEPGHDGITFLASKAFKAEMDEQAMWSDADGNLGEGV